MANVKKRSGVVRNAVGAILAGKTATLKNHATGLPITSNATDENGRYTFAGLDETIRYEVSVAFGSGSSQVHVNSPISPDLDDAYVNSSLRTAPAATVAFGGPVSIVGPLTVNVLNATTINGTTVNAGDLNVSGIASIPTLHVNIMAPVTGSVIAIPSHALAVTNSVANDYALRVAQDKLGQGVAYFSVNPVAGGGTVMIDQNANVQMSEFVRVCSLAVGTSQPAEGGLDFGDSHDDHTGGMLRFEERQAPINMPATNTTVVWYDYEKLTLGLKRHTGATVYLPTVTPGGGMVTTGLTVNGPSTFNGPLGGTNPLTVTTAGLAVIPPSGNAFLQVIGGTGGVGNAALELRNTRAPANCKSVDLITDSNGYLNITGVGEAGATMGTWLQLQRSLVTGVPNFLVLGAGVTTQLGLSIAIGEFNASAGLLANDHFLHAGTLGFFGATGQTKPNVTGPKGGNAALTSLCAALATLGLITNSTS
jgi:hypothetical protein